MAREFKVDKCPHEALSYTNRVFFCKEDLDTDMFRTVELTNGPSSMLFNTASDKTGFNDQKMTALAQSNKVSSGRIGLNAAQRKQLNVGIGSVVRVAPFEFKSNQPCYAVSAVVELDFVNRKSVSASEQFNTELLAREFTGQLANLTVCVGQSLLLNFNMVVSNEKEKDKEKSYTALIMVKELEAVSKAALSNMSAKPDKVSAGIVMPNTAICFDKAPDLPILLTGRCKGKSAFQPIINPEWDFTKMGIGGLDNEFSSIFRRAFASRVFPPELILQLGLKHVRGILLYGPPGTGKTLMARQIGKMLNAREPKIVSGPQILDKYVGESEANIRKLFADAEEEEKRLGPNSGLHIIIFDEIDAICKQRGSAAGSTQVHDTVVNQMLAKMDGVEQLNNILVIGMTNRLDMIDDALLRPGRFEVKMEISLPDEHGRLQILNIHTARLRENRKLSNDVNLSELAAATKNFSGAELEGLCRAAISTSMNRLVKAKSKVEVDPDAIERLVVSRDDFMNALQNDVKAAFGSSSEDLSVYFANGIIAFGDPVTRVLNDAKLFINQVRSSTRTPLVTVLLAGPASAGKTALAAHIAQRSEFPYTKICSPETMIGYSEAAKCAAIKRFFDDAYKSPLSCIILDDIERLLDYSPVGQRYSNLVLQALLVLLKKLPSRDRKLLVIGTTSNREVLANLELLNVFSSTVHVSNLTRVEHIVSALAELGDFTDAEIQRIAAQLTGKRLSIGIKKFLVFLEMARQAPEEQRADKFVMIMEDEGCVYTE